MPGYKAGLSLALMGPLKQTGLALATSASGVVNLLLLLWLLRKRVGLLGGRRLFKSGLGTCSAAAVMGLLVALVAYGPDWGDPSGAMWRWARPVAALAVGAASYFAAAKLMRLAELGELWQVFRRSKVLGPKGPRKARQPLGRPVWRYRSHGLNRRVLNGAKSC